MPKSNDNLSVEKIIKTNLKLAILKEIKFIFI
jgi:hypothetical protein